MLKQEFQLVYLLAVLVVSPWCSIAAAQESIDLTIRSPEQQLRVVAKLEHSGSVIIIPEVIADEDEGEAPAETSGQPKSLPLKVDAELRYFQRTTSAQQAIRFFDRAQANIQLEDGKLVAELSEDNQLIIARLKSTPRDRVELASMLDTLSQSEFDLIQTSADPLTLEAMFSRKDVKVGSSWTPDQDSLARFLRVDSIDRSDVKLTVKDRKDGIVRVYLSGTVTGRLFDVKTDMSVNGIALIDTGSSLVRNLKLSIDETRPPGQIVPGFEGRTRIELGLSVGESTDRLTNESLAKVIDSKKIQQRLKYVSNEGGFRIDYDPRWKLIAGEADTALLRFIDNGDLLTQCNFVLLPARPADEPLSLKVFQEEVTKIIGADKNAQLLKTDSRTTSDGLTALSVVVTGEEEEVPVNWFYYHVSDKTGRQVTFVFTLDASVASRVIGAANQLVNEFQFLTPVKAVASKSTAADSKDPAKKR